MCLLLAFAGNSTYAQHDHDTTDRSAQLQFAPVQNTFLSDPDLKKFQLQSSLMTVPPSLVDTVSHRHDADLFGYVIEGTVEVGLDYKAPVIFKTSQMLHEKRNAIHSLLSSVSRQLKPIDNLKLKIKSKADRIPSAEYWLIAIEG
jgi:quercetin dioxygenase-like cupin family protein